MQTSLQRLRSVFLGFLGALALLNLWACSDLKFVTVTAAPTADDSREDIVVEGVEAQFTSGSLVQNRVIAGKGRYREEKGLLILEEPTIQFYDSNSSHPSTTRAQTATFYFAEDRKTKHQKGDVALSGQVRHVIPRKDDPTTAMVFLETDNLAWRAKAQVFEGRSFYRMVLSPPNAAPLVAVGDAFIASKDLRNWNVRHGGLASHVGDEDFRQKNRERGQLLDSVSTESGQEGIPDLSSAAPVSQLSSGESEAGASGATAETTRLLHRLPMASERLR